MIKLSIVHDCFLDGNLHVLLFREKVFVLWYCMFWHLCLDLINLNDIQDWWKIGFYNHYFVIFPIYEFYLEDNMIYDSFIVKEYSIKSVYTWRRNKTLLEIVKYMISISICLFHLEIYSNKYYTFSKIDFKSLFLWHLSNCGLGENLVYDTSTFGDVQHLC